VSKGLGSSDAVCTVGLPADELGESRSLGSRQTPSISLVLPAFNEEPVIGRAIREADDALADLTDDYEIPVVDDGSTDRPRAVAVREASRRTSVRVISHASNQGYGAALRTGFRAARKQWVGFTDADCQFDVRQPKTVIVATPWRHDQVRLELGDQVDITPTRSGRGRIIEASSRAHVLVGASGGVLPLR